MILLSSSQTQELAIPLIYKTMGSEIGDKAKYEFSESAEPTDLWGYFDKNILVAVAGLGSEISPKKVWLGYLAVMPSYQGSGLGTEALQFIEQVAKQRRYKWILVETYDNPLFEKALKFYKKHGYIKVGTLADYLEDDSDIIYFRKNLED